MCRTSTEIVHGILSTNFTFVSLLYGSHLYLLDLWASCHTYIYLLKMIYNFGHHGRTVTIMLLIALTAVTDRFHMEFNLR